RALCLCWTQRRQRPNAVRPPPVVPYWLAVPVRLFGDRPALWKLWLLPFCLLFVAALHGIFRRFAPGQERLLTALTVLSPTFLPGLNLMLDIPALALTLGALVTFASAAERGSWALAGLAGRVAGLAMQTKSPAFLAPPLLLLYALTARRLGLGIMAAAGAVLVFVGWEWFTVLKYGESSFVLALGRSPRLGF